jgi:Zn-dependent oligopeptidase
LEFATATQNDALKHLPKFAHIQPRHLEKAASIVKLNFQRDLAQLELDLATGQKTYSLSALLLKMDQLQSPITHLQEIATLYTTLAANPDTIEMWRDVTAAGKASKSENDVKRLLSTMAGQSSPLYRSSILHKELHRAAAAASSSREIPNDIAVAFSKQGMHMEIDENETDAIQEASPQQQLRDIHAELQTIHQRLSKVTSYEHASKAVRLQCVSDMYHSLGLAKMQASLLGYSSVKELASKQHNHMMPLSAEEWSALQSDIAKTLQPYLPQHTRLNLDGAGAFLTNDKHTFNALPTKVGEAHLQVLKAKYECKQCLRLHGIMQGLMDFCDAIFGIAVTEDAVCQQEGWNKNVRLLHLYKKNEDEENNDSPGTFLGTIYLDPFADAYWRTEDAEELVMTRLFSQNIHQTVAPVVIMALKIRHSWDDAPVPVSWEDTRDLLYNFGKAMQLILEQNTRRENIIHGKAPIDTSEFLGHVSIQ